MSEQRCLQVTQERFVTMEASIEQEYVRSTTPPIPTGTKPLQHQVAGHVFGRPNGQNYNKVGQLLLLMLSQ